MEFAPVRFNQLQRYLKKVSDKTLSQNLKELERDGLITRTVYPQIPQQGVAPRRLRRQGEGHLGAEKAGLEFLRRDIRETRAPPPPAACWRSCAPGSPTASAVWARSGTWRPWSCGALPQ